MNILLAIALLFAGIPAPASPYIVTAEGAYGATIGGALPLTAGGQAQYKIYTANNYYLTSSITAKWPRACNSGGLAVKTDEIAIDGGFVLVSFLYRGRFVSASFVELQEYDTQIVKAPRYTAVIIANAAGPEILRTNRTVIYFSGLGCVKR